MKFRALQVGAILSLITLCHSPAAVLYVDINGSNPTPPYSSWSTASTDIQSAIDAANDGDQILVTNGVYQTGGRVVYGALTNRVVINKAVTVQSVNGPSLTIIQGNPVMGDSAVRCVYITNNATLSGFTLTNGATRNPNLEGNDEEGGGVWCDGTNAIITNCVIVGNVANFSGGGASGGVLNRCLLTGNTAGGNPNYTTGGGADSSILNFCILNGNSAGDGGGAAFSTLNNCLVTSNGGSNAGGGYFCTFNCCTIVGNGASFGAGVEGGFVNNSIVYYNDGPNFYTDANPSYFGYVVLSNCCTFPMPLSGSGNITNEPLFLNLTNGNYRLHINSPCINTGNNAYVNWDADLDGNPRIVNNIVDIGAYEYQAPALAIVTQPVSQTNLIGQTAMFSVSAESPYYPINYQWQFNSNNIAGATNSSLVLTNLQTTNTGTYGVVVSVMTSNSLAILISSNALLSVFYPPPVITQQPTNVSVILGSNTMISVTATSYLDMTFQWQLNGTNLLDGGEFSGSTNAALLISGANTNDAGNYQVVISDGEFSVTSAVATVTVLTPPFLTTQPTNLTVISPNNASFTIASAGTQPLAYQWYFNGTALENGGRVSGANSTNLTITSTQAGDMGSYQVVVTNSFGGATSAVVTLSVLVAEHITEQPASEAVLLTSNATFSVTDAGTFLSYQWYFNGTPLADDGRISGSTTANLTINNVQTSDAGRYWVVVSNILNSSTSIVASLTALTNPGPSIRYVNLSNPNPASPYLDWNTAATNIQDAIDAAVDGDQIFVTNGVYQFGGRVVYGALANRVVINKAVTVQSVNGAAVTIIQGQRSGSFTNGNSAVRCVYLTNNATLIGFTLTNGATRSFGDSIKEESGGGIWCEPTNVVVSNCVINANAAANQGGGAYGGTLVNCTLVNNSSVMGGGESSSVLIGCALETNSASDGGGAYQGLIENCLIAGNMVGGTTNIGGGVYNAIVRNSVISGNSCGYSGGGAFGGSLVNCTVTANSATNAVNSTGGGVAQCNATNCIFYYNTAHPGAANYTNWILGSLDHCCTTPLPNGTGNITNEPLLATISHLSTNSPCIAAGNVMAISGTDIDGEGWANPPSIGCDEVYPGNVVGNITASIWTIFTNLAPGYGALFVANNTGPISGSQWDFGDGTVVTNQPWVSHSWSAPGDYPVVLTVYNDSNPGGVSTTLLMHIAIPTVFYVNLNSANAVAPYSSWSTAAANIQDAVDVAGAGSLVLVTNGSVPGQSNGIAIYQFGGRAIYGSLSNRVAITRPLTVQSVNGPAVTMIKGNGSGNLVRCAYLTNGAVLSGFTLTNGYATLGGSDVVQGQSGGGTWAESSNAIVTNCVITGCNASYAGAGAYSGSLYNCTLKINGSLFRVYGGGADASVLNNCTLLQNSAGNGGGAAANSLLNNCLITNNSASGSTGGGVYLCTLINCTLAANSAGTGYGGGAYGGSLSNCTVNGNSATYGGGAYGGSGGLSVVLNNCTVSSNTASYGAGIYGALSSYCRANGCLLNSNVATVFGGGSYEATLDGCTLSNNLASASGGGAEGGVLAECVVVGNASRNSGGGADGSSAGAAILNNCTLSGNAATNSGGGASLCVLNNSILSGNSTLHAGGGAYSSTLIGCFVLSNSAPTTLSVPTGGGGGTSSCHVTNCVLAFNTAGTNGGGDSQSTLVNCTIVGNSAPLGGGVVNSTADNCIIYFNSGGNYWKSPFPNPLALNYCCTSPGTNGPGNITNDPALVNFATGDFHLQSMSPCINSGDNLWVSTTNDLGGNPRILAGTVDIGAYEYQTPASVLSYAWAQEYGLPLDGSADYLDLDGTGMNNWQKSIAGLNPTNSASTLTMLAPVVTNSVTGAVISWESVNTRIYYLQRASNLAGQPAFTTIQSNVVGQAGITSYTDTSATNGGPYFYRVGVQ